MLEVENANAEGAGEALLGADVLYETASTVKPNSAMKEAIWLVEISSGSKATFTIPSG
jgi:hypothetical protein